MRRLITFLYLLAFIPVKAGADLELYLACMQYGYDMAASASASVVLSYAPGPPPSVVFGFCITDGCWAPGHACGMVADPGSDGGSISGVGPRSGGGSCSKGSIIDPNQRSVGESIAIVGTPFSLRYFSDRGRRSFEYEISTKVCQTDRAAGSLPDCRITYEIAGQSASDEFIAASTSTYDFTWNSLDNSSTKIYFSRPVTVTYEMLNLPSPLDNAAFPVVRDRTLGTYDANFYGLGGWGIDQLHAYDPDAKVLYYGYGSSEQVDGIATGGGNWLVKPPGGNEVYEFSSNGHHLYTKTALLGATLYTFSYNGSGHLSQISDGYGNDTVISRNGSGYLTGITGPYGQYTDIDLNGNGYIETVTDPNSKTTNITYSDSNGLIATFQRPGLSAVEFTHTANGLLIEDEHPSGRTLAYTSSSDPWPYVTETTSEGVVNIYQPTYAGYDDNFSYQSYGSNMASGAAYSFQYQSGQYVTQVNSIKTQTVSYSNDDRDSIWKQIASVAKNTPLNTVNYTESRTHSHTLSTPTDVFSVTNATFTSTINSKTFTMDFNAGTNAMTVTSPESRYYSYTIDANERPVTVSVPGLSNVVYTYDANGRVESVAKGSRSLTYTYNAGGYIESVTDALSHETSYDYDSAGRVTQVTLPDSRTIAMDYDDRGNLTSVTTPNSKVSTLTPNSWDSLIEFLPPAVTGIATPETIYEYDLDQRLTKITKPDATEVEFLYGSTTGNLESVTTPQGSNYIALDNGGNLISASLNGVDVARGVDGYVTTYDEIKIYNWGTSSFDGGRVEYAYTSEGRQNSLNVRDIASTSNINANFTYDNDGLLINAGNTTYTYDPDNGKLTNIDNGNVHIEITYNGYGDIYTYTAKYNTTTIYAYTLTYFNDGRISSKTENVQGTTDTYTYDYDDAGRLEAVYKNLNPQSSFVYDSNSNRTSGTVNGTSFSATYDDQDRILTWGAWNFNHSDSGERTAKIHSGTMAMTSYTYDAFEQLIAVDASGLDRDYVLDGLGRRFQVKTSTSLDRQYVYAGQYRLIGELDSANDVKKLFVYGSKSHVPDYYTDGTDDFMLITDHLGSVRLAVKVSDGTIVQRNDYNDLGGVSYTTGASAQPLRYAGGIYDGDTGFVKFGVRDYDPETGRWTSKDPILFKGGDTNLYGYVLADPINFIDPSGKSLSDVNWTNVIGGAGLVGGGYTAIVGGAGFIGTGWGAPLGYVGVGIGTGALIEGAGLLANELANFLKDPSGNGPLGTSGGQGANVCSMR